MCGTGIGPVSDTSHGQDARATRTMPLFAYTARDGTGAPLSGTLNASSESEVTQLLRREGKYATSIQLAREGAPSLSFPGTSSGALSATGIKIARADVIQISQQLS